jgi:hypothetical protein
MTTTLPILTYAEAQSVGEVVHDHWLRMIGEAPIGRDNLGWADLVQFRHPQGLRAGDRAQCLWRRSARVTACRGSTLT